MNVTSVTFGICILHFHRSKFPFFTVDGKGVIFVIWGKFRTETLLIMIYHMMVWYSWYCPCFLNVIFLILSSVTDEDRTSKSDTEWPRPGEIFPKRNSPKFQKVQQFSKLKKKKKLYCNNVKNFVQKFTFYAIWYHSFAFLTRLWYDQFNRDKTHIKSSHIYDTNTHP